jgi:hypothetical protein
MALLANFLLLKDAGSKRREWVIEERESDMIGRSNANFAAA